MFTSGTYVGIWASSVSCAPLVVFVFVMPAAARGRASGPRKKAKVKAGAGSPARRRRAVLAALAGQKDGRKQDEVGFSRDSLQSHVFWEVESFGRLGAAIFRATQGPKGGGCGLGRSRGYCLEELMCIYYL
jgi:hypothetical protein